MKTNTYEEKIKRISQILSTIEANEKNLDETIKLFEEAKILIKECEDSLNNFDKKLQKINFIEE